MHAVGYLIRADEEFVTSLLHSTGFTANLMHDRVVTNKGLCTSSLARIWVRPKIDTDRGVARARDAISYLQTVAKVDEPEGSGPPLITPCSQ